MDRFSTDSPALMPTKGRTPLVLDMLHFFVSYAGCDRASTYVPCFVCRFRWLTNGLLLQEEVGGSVHLSFSVNCLSHEIPRIGCSRLSGMVG